MGRRRTNVQLHFIFKEELVNKKNYFYLENEDIFP